MDTVKTTIESSQVDNIKSALNSLLNPYGFNVAPFLVSWYNKIVSPRLHLQYGDPNHLAFCIISTPEMFEKSFLPHVFGWLEKYKTLSNAFTQFNWPREFSPKDPLDRSVYLRITETLSNLPNVMADSGITLQLQDAKWLPDYALKPVNYLPLVHATTAGHVSGMAYFHNQRNLEAKDNTDEVKGFFGCSLHPYHGGWFALRGVFLFPKLLCPTLIEIPPQSSLATPLESKIVAKLLTEYNKNWQTNEWREFGLPEPSTDEKEKNSNLPPRRYSLAARMFFNTPCKSRPELLELWYSEGVPKIDALGS